MRKRGGVLARKSANTMCWHKFFGKQRGHFDSQTICTIHSKYIATSSKICKDQHQATSFAGQRSRLLRAFDPSTVFHCECGFIRMYRSNLPLSFPLPCDCCECCCIRIIKINLPLSFSLPPPPQERHGHIYCNTTQTKTRANGGRHATPPRPCPLPLPRTFTPLRVHQTAPGAPHSPATTMNFSELFW